MLNPRRAVETLPSYHPPLAGRDGLRLDFNENTVGCSPRVIDRLRQLSADDLVKYPERGPVEAKVAEFLGVTPEEVLLTNGVDEAIHLLCQTYLESGDEALIVVPTYSMYRIYAMAAGGNVITVPMGEGFRFPVPEVTAAINPRTRLIAIANPNNPTGTVAAMGELLQIAQSAPSAAVFIDEAYYEFYGKSMLNARAKAPNIFIARTFSKAYGMAGVRIGVLIGNVEQMRGLRRMSSPYNVNAVALACLPEAIRDQAYIERYLSEVRESRVRLEVTLEASGIQFWRSQGNFVLARVGSSSADAAAFVDHMRRRGILVRDRSSDHGCEGCVRITLGSKEHADRLLEALQEVFARLGIAVGASRK